VQCSAVQCSGLHCAARVEQSRVVRAAGVGAPRCIWPRPTNLVPRLYLNNHRAADGSGPAPLCSALLCSAVTAAALLCSAYLYCSADSWSSAPLFSFLCSALHTSTALLMAGALLCSAPVFTLLWLKMHRIYVTSHYFLMPRPGLHQGITLQYFAFRLRQMRRLGSSWP
jgi:hypothetical protein